MRQKFVFTNVFVWSTGPSGTNIHRIQGTPKYAQPPMGTYSPSLGQPDGSGMSGVAGLETVPPQPQVPGGFAPPPTSGSAAESYFN